MKCPHVQCKHNEECAILDITRKVPKSAGDCSYSEKIKAAPKPKKMRL